jgi:methionyl-tRNA synthetase
MLSAKAQNITPEQLIAAMQQKHYDDITGFHVEFSNYYTTHSPENQELVQMIYERLKQNNDIEVKTIEQAYDPVANMFLPDRFIKGTCPRCRSENQHGDNCEVCGATYSSDEVINPISVISGATPIKKASEHYFFKIEKYAAMLNSWAHAGHVQTEIAHKLDEWFKTGLKPWDISRDAPYFGFPIPGAKDKYFYVWLDAPIGYIASFKNLAEKQSNLNFSEYWEKEDTTELHHFVGKDIVYFHALFWPAMLEGAKLRKPTKIYTHGYLTINGQKMSKSRGTFITARAYLDNNLNPEHLRYYFAAKLNAGIADIDLNLEDFMLRVNSDLVGKVVNIASRCASFINKHFDGKLAKEAEAKQLFDDFADTAPSIAKSYETLEYNNAMRLIMGLADKVNQYIDENKPWHLAKQEENLPRVQMICSTGLNLFRLLIIYLKPVLPKTAELSEMFLNVEPLKWEDKNKLLLDHKINAFQPLMQRIDKTQLAMISG